MVPTDRDAFTKVSKRTSACVAISHNCFTERFNKTPDPPSRALTFWGVNQSEPEKEDRRARQQETSRRVLGRDLQHVFILFVSVSPLASF